MPPSHCCTHSKSSPCPSAESPSSCTNLRAWERPSSANHADRTGWWKYGPGRPMDRTWSSFAVVVRMLEPTADELAACCCCWPQQQPNCVGQPEQGPLQGRKVQKSLYISRNYIICLCRVAMQNKREITTYVSSLMFTYPIAALACN